MGFGASVSCWFLNWSTTDTWGQRSLSRGGGQALRDVRRQQQKGYGTCHMSPGGQDPSSREPLSQTLGLEVQ